MDQRPGHLNHAGPHAPNVTYAQHHQPGSVQYAPTQFAYTAAPASSHAGLNRAPAAHAAGAGFQYANLPDKINYTAKPIPTQAQAAPVRHTMQSHPPPAHPQYTAMAQAPPLPAPQASSQQSYPPPPMGTHSPHPTDNYHMPAHTRTPSTQEGRRVVEMVPGGGGKLNAPPSSGLRPHGLANRMDRLSVSGDRPDVQTIVPGGMFGGMAGAGGLPPPSPLLEAYHGTYQSISPMPHAMMLDDDLDHIPSLDSLSPRGSTQSFHGPPRAHSRSRQSPSPPSHSRPQDRLALDAYGGGRDNGAQYSIAEKEKRRVRIYDATDDAFALVDAMAAKTPDADTIIDILPALSHDQMLELRAEYKRHCKVQGRGINIAKHIKMKTSGNFGKIAYVTALGKYEGEGYWANYWYQSNSARRELLIEALMGRQNYDIREIKDAFKDKRYSDSLTRCMDKELKADKFRKAVLMALEGERQEESDVWPVEYRNRDVDTLYKAIKAREGGESAMLSVVLLRSDAHLREVLRTYERNYQASFARDALKKSNNLVVCFTAQQRLLHSHDLGRGCGTYPQRCH